MYNYKNHISNHNHKMNGTGALTITKQFWIPMKTVFNGWRHCHTRKHSQWCQEKYHTEIRELLQRIKMIKAIWFNRHIQCGIMNKNIPGIRDDFPGYRNKALPLVGIK